MPDRLQFQGLSGMATPVCPCVGNRKRIEKEPQAASNWNRHHHIGMPMGRPAGAPKNQELFFFPRLKRAAGGSDSSASKGRIRGSTRRTSVIRRLRVLLRSGLLSRGPDLQCTSGPPVPRRQVTIPNAHT